MKINTASKPRLYGFVSYDRSAKVRWLLTELGLDFENHWVDGEKGELESPEFRLMSPMGRIPVLQSGKESIFESGAICADLADQFAERGLAPALSAPERGAYLQWMFFASATLDTMQIRIMIIEDIPAGPVLDKKLTSLQTDFRDALGALDRTLSKHSFLVGNRFTAADICVSYHLYWLGFWPELSGISADFPHVLGYLERMKKMPSAVKADVFSYKE